MPYGYICRLPLNCLTLNLVFLSTETYESSKLWANDESSRQHSSHKYQDCLSRSIGLMIWTLRERFSFTETLGPSIQQRQMQNYPFTNNAIKVIRPEDLRLVPCHETPAFSMRRHRTSSVSSQLTVAIRYPSQWLMSPGCSTIIGTFSGY